MGVQLPTMFSRTLVASDIGMLEVDWRSGRPCGAPGWLEGAQRGRSLAAADTGWAEIGRSHATSRTSVADGRDQVSESVGNKIQVFSAFLMALGSIIVQKTL